MTELMTGFVLGLAVGAAAFYVLGYNVGAHPGKVAAQFARLWADIRWRFGRRPPP